MAASSLDIAKFTKVHALMKGGATEGERSAARTRAMAMAKRAGMTLESAIKLVSRPETAQERARREMAEQFARMRRAREAEAVGKYGPVEVIFAESAEEARLSAAAEAFKVYSGDPEFPPYVESLSGWSGDYGDMPSVTALPAQVAEAIRNAIPWPHSVREAFNEILRWHQLLRPRFAFDSDYHREPWVAAREDLLGELFWSLGASNLDDIAAREAWAVHRMGTGVWWPEDTARLAARLRMDAEWVVHETMMRMFDRSPRAMAPTTATERRRQVASMLDAEPELSDREIARRCGVSPTTVGSLRRKAAGSTDPAATPTAP